MSTNGDIVLSAMTGLFVERDTSVVDRYWAEEYHQHSTSAPDGREDLAEIVEHLPADFGWEPGVVVASGDLVMVHGRYTGRGPVPLVAVDIVRLEGGRLVEHWDVLQPEQPTVSGRGMFTPAPVRADRATRTPQRGGAAGSDSASATARANRDIVLAAMTGVFVDRDTSVIPRYWSTEYAQHNPGMADGRDDLAGLVDALPADFRYEPGMIVAEGDHVMIHGRYTGWAGRTMIAVDVFRLEDDRLVEHWDVLQEEQPTASGRPMFSPGA